MLLDLGNEGTTCVLINGSDVGAGGSIIEYFHIEVGGSVSGQERSTDPSLSYSFPLSDSKGDFHA
jgi:hypothetical protein